MRGDSKTAISAAAANYADRWLGGATDEALESLLQSHPAIPKPVDAYLLREVESDIGESLRDCDPLRRAARKAFWERIGRDV